MKPIVRNKLVIAISCIVVGIPAVTILCPFLVIGSIWFITGGPDYRIDLADGYQLVRFYAGAIAMYDSNDKIVLEPNVDRYAIVSKLVIGHVGPEGETGSDWSKGYFIVDTKNCTVKQGIDKDAWIRMLCKQGINPPPRLRRPSKPILKSIYRRWISHGH